eukprot:2161925-Prymnesium_polylepis.1
MSHRRGTSAQVRPNALSVSPMCDAGGGFGGSNARRSDPGAERCFLMKQKPSPARYGIPHSSNGAQGRPMARTQNRVHARRVLSCVKKRKELGANESRLRRLVIVWSRRRRNLR